MLLDIVTVALLLCVQQGRLSSETSNSNQATFGRLSSDRQLNLSERKKALIESARQRYIEKHGLTSSWSFTLPPLPVYSPSLCVCSSCLPTAWISPVLRTIRLMLDRYGSELTLPRHWGQTRRHDVLLGIKTNKWRKSNVCSPYPLADCAEPFYIEAEWRTEHIR